MGLDSGLVDSVANANVKTVGEAAAHSMALAMQNSVAHQNRLNILAETAMAQAIKGLQEVDPLEAISTVKALTGNDNSQAILAQLAALASGQQAAKIGQSTPPETARVA